MKNKILELIDRKIESYTQTLSVGEILAFQELRQEIEEMEDGYLEEEWEKWKHTIELVEQSKKKDITEFINI